MSELADAVRRRAGNRCEYCHLPQSAFRRAFHLEHIVARQHGGLSQFDNLAPACWTCNFKKGPNLAGVDPSTGALAVLFHPRTDEWQEHFRPIVTTSLHFGVTILGVTPVGRATVQVLGFNQETRQTLRYELRLEGLYTAEES